MRPKDQADETLGRRLRRLRDEAGLTQEQLAAKAGLPLPSLRNWEVDYRQPRVEALLKVAKALGVRLEELAVLIRSKGEKKAKKETAGLRRLMVAWRRASSIERRAFRL